MINNIKKFRTNNAFSGAAARAFRENLKGAAVEAAITYAGFEPIDTTVDFIQMEGDLCRVDFRYTRWQAEDVTECGMSWEAWVDVNTMEVVGLPETHSAPPPARPSTAEARVK